MYISPMIIVYILGIIVSFNYILPTIATLFSLVNHKLDLLFDDNKKVKQPLIGFHMESEEEMDYED